ncbi:MAG: SIS domain-containing protein [Defluviitaleaceae bacterium]|nr:SIS domain-containing protein [Defluviitaleaceae bacterium]
MTFKYIAEIKKQLERLEKEGQEAMAQAVDVITTAIVAKQSIFGFGASHAGILIEEMYYRAGGLVVFNPIFGRELMLDTVPVSHTSKMERLVGYGDALLKNTPIKKGDVLIAHSVSGRNPVTIEIAQGARDVGATVIAVTNVQYSESVTSRHPNGKRLFELADIVLDNYGHIGDACVDLPGLSQKVAPSSTVIGATILNAVVAQVAEELIKKGLSTPPIFYSANLDGGDQLNRKIYNEFKEGIHYKFV